MANIYSILLTVVTILAGLIWWYDARVNKPQRQAKITAEEERLQETLSEDA
ncbi:S26 family signal peptidase, partial [Pseudidiomarina aestuarii]